MAASPHQIAKDKTLSCSVRRPRRRSSMLSVMERLTRPVRRGLRLSPSVVKRGTHPIRRRSPTRAEKYSGSLGCHEHANDNLQRSATRMVGNASTCAPPGHGAHRKVPACVSHSLADADTSNLKGTKRTGVQVWRVVAGARAREGGTFSGERWRSMSAVTVSPKTTFPPSTSPVAVPNARCRTRI